MIILADLQVGMMMYLVLALEDDFNKSMESRVLKHVEHDVIWRTLACLLEDMHSVYYSP